MNRLVFVGETLRAALNERAREAADWLKPQIQPGWLECYERRFDDDRLPKGQEERQALAEEIGADGRHLLQAIFQADCASTLLALPAVRILSYTWLQQYHAVEEGQAMRWRSEKELPPSAQRLHSPSDTDARYGSKRTTTWLGYKLFRRLGIAHWTKVLEPPGQRIDGEFWGVGGLSNGHLAKIVGDIVDAVGNGLTACVAGKIMHVDGRGLPAPLGAMIQEIAQPFLLLGIDADRGPARFGKVRSLRVQILKLALTVGMRFGMKTLDVAFGTNLLLI